MPVFEYTCESCGPFETLRNHSEGELRTCPNCFGRVQRSLSVSAIKTMKPFGPHISIAGYPDKPISSSGH